MSEVSSQECICSNCGTKKTVEVTGPESIGRPEGWGYVKIWVDTSQNSEQLMCDGCVGWLQTGLATAREQAAIDHGVEQDEKPEGEFVLVTHLSTGAKAYIPVTEAHEWDELKKSRAQETIKKVEEQD